MDQFLVSGIEHVLNKNKFWICAFKKDVIKSKHLRKLKSEKIYLNESLLILNSITDVNLTIDLTKDHHVKAEKLRSAT